MKPKISIIVPCFNEEESLPLFYQEMVRVMQKMDNDFELLFINDGSKDKTSTDSLSGCSFSSCSSFIDGIIVSSVFGSVSFLSVTGSFLESFKVG